MILITWNALLLHFELHSTFKTALSYLKQNYYLIQSQNSVSEYF